MTKSYNVVFVGLTLSSSWGNGHATTYRSLIKGLRRQGQSVLFLERDVPWYRDNRDLPDPDFCDLSYYSDLDGLLSNYGEELKSADAVIIGSYVPDGVAVIDAIRAVRQSGVWFYDIDTPVTLSKLAAGDEEYVAARQITDFEGYFSFSGGRAISVLMGRYGARAAYPLYCAVDAEHYRSTDERHQWDLGYLGTYSPDRQPTLTRLLIEPARHLPHMRFVVAGPQYPDTIDWPANVERIDHLPPSRHASFYSRQRFTLNVTREDMIAYGHSPSVRLFEAAACGTPVVSDRWEGIETLLPNGRAILLADTAQDVISLLLDHDENWRAQIGDGARRRIIAHHTGEARAKELIDFLNPCRAQEARVSTTSLAQPSK